MNNDKAHREPRINSTNGHSNHQNDHLKLREAFRMHEQQWRMALEDDLNDEPLSSGWKHRCRGPLAVCAILATASALILGPSTSVGQHIHHEISHTLAQFTMPQSSDHAPSAPSPIYQSSTPESAS
ncbi:hypothetical protein [Phytohalomonas tamaricis]|uniref:hypothetical protein n=1 Tax=Phytohalomonas tamaricis TaxID=2081032 RepID=UPI000D0ADDEE|nr:hypothetical protein [Phytohalomonas tamaricis]